ncbi:MAG TPA: hypothetical protein VHU91_03630 [Mycobacteriales bacterium]|nr:hypothetical protein [Mycobacteriales bacterium]
MQDDSNVVLCNTANKPLWATTPRGNPVSAAQWARSLLPGPLS